jgi:iron(III) transport system substrate-binding protein
MRWTIWVTAFCLVAAGCSRPNRVTIYCALDREFSERLLERFARETGLTVAPRFDTEANKSVAIVEDLKREKDRPRCDVHWNNEIIGTIRLQRAGVLEPYDSPSAAGYPGWSRAKDRTWQAFAARARVLIVNTKLLRPEDYPKSILDLAKPPLRGRVAMAKPIFGTTATHAACLFEVLGPARAEQFFRDLKANAVQIVPGNKQSAERVGRGEYPCGLTDTDDAMAEIKAGRPVEVVYLDTEAHPEFPRLGTLYIPNTLALIRGAPNPDGGRKLIDYLLSPEMEQALAESASAQIPLNPQVQAKLPEAIRRPSQVRAMEVDFERATDYWEQSQKLMRELFTDTP